MDAPGSGEFQRWSASRALANTFSLLIDAARESGQLDALAEALKPHEEARGRDAEALSLMVAIARGRTDGLAARVLDRVKGLAIPKDALPSPLAFEDGAELPNPPLRGSWLDGLISALDSTGEGEADLGAWLKVGDEIRGRRSTDSPRQSPESVLLA